MKSSAALLSSGLELEKNYLASTRFQIIPLNTFGAVIKGLNISYPCEQQISALREALLKYKMLLVRNQHLTATEQIRLTQMFGSELHTAGPSLRQLPEFPEIFQITNQPGKGNSNTGQYWHVDGHYLSDPSPITVMHMVKSSNDGPTLVTDSAAAFERLPNELKKIISHYAFLTMETGVAHFILRSHPVTNQIGLYVNLRAIAIDRTLQRNTEVNALIERHLNEPGSFYEHHWQDGDTLIVDNFSTIHRGLPSNPSQLRLMHRTSLTGRSVWWRH